ncbi:hypothetical protein MRX96_025781 [Rhipicephalus microplus]
MVGNIKDAFKRFLYALIGIGGELYKMTEQRISKMAALIGYPDGTPNSSDLNDYYASLHPGIFYHDGPASVNYGGLGTVVAREMVQILGLQTFTREQGTTVWRNRSNVAEHFASIPRCLRKSLKETKQLFHVNLTSERLDSENLSDFLGASGGPLGIHRAAL